MRDHVIASTRGSTTLLTDYRWPVAGKDRDILEELNGMVAFTYTHSRWKSAVVRVSDLHQVASEQDTNPEHPKLSPEMVGYTDHAQPRDPFEFSADNLYDSDLSHLVGPYSAMSSTFMSRESGGIPQYDILGADAYASIVQWSSSTNSGHWAQRLGQASIIIHVL
jgi:hypothetical protein